MLNQNSIKELSIKIQTTEENIAREYIQYLFLSSFYQQEEAGAILFKGGTALRIIYESPRFSEDLDFTITKKYSQKNLDSLFISSLAKINEEGIKTESKEAKITTGGYLGIFSYSLYGFYGEIALEISFRKGNNIKKEVKTIISPYVPPFLILFLSPQELVKEKLLALQERHKPRDYYDLYFILRHPELNKFIDFKKIKKVKEILLKEKINFKSELEILLPINHHLILKDFKQFLIKEIDKYNV